MTDVAANWRAVLERVRLATARAGRPEGSVELVAVSKLQPPEAIRAAYAGGARIFGENYAQELRDKAAALSDLEGIRWHAIGPLQTNKARYVARSAHVFHALDVLDRQGARTTGCRRMSDGVDIQHPAVRDRVRGVTIVSISCLADAVGIARRRAGVRSSLRIGDCVDVQRPAVGH